MIGALLKAFLPRHLDWLADVVGDVIEIIEDGTDAARRGWSEADDDELAQAIADVARKIGQGIRTAVHATEATRPRRRRFARGGGT